MTVDHKLASPHFHVQIQSRPLAVDNKWLIYYIYIYAFSRRFYPKRLTLHSSYSFYISSALAFPGKRTHDLGVAGAMLYQLSYKRAISPRYILLYNITKIICTSVGLCHCLMLDNRMWLKNVLLKLPYFKLLMMPPPLFVSYPQCSCLDANICHNE